MSVDQNLWFDDRYADVAVAGLKYYYFEMADDPRAGTVSGNWPAEAVSYTGQRAEFLSAIKEMADAEDIGGDMQVMPDDFLGVSYSYAGLTGLYGSGGGAQPVPPPAGGGGEVPLNFADDETVMGSGRYWTLTHVPSPVASLTLYQALPGFGSVLLNAGTDYTILGAIITTTNTITAGSLSAWYRY
jgi:hypothetical protein